jgi:hypothetical protein
MKPQRRATLPAVADLILVRSSVHAIDQPTARRLYTECWLIVWSTCWLGLFSNGIIAALIFDWPWLAAVALPIFLISQIAAIVLGFRFRCPACQGRLLVQGFSTLHPARRILFLGIASWIAVAFDIARHREFICMHCGERCTVEI